MNNNGRQEGFSSPNNIMIAMVIILIVNNHSYQAKTIKPINSL